MPIHRPSASLKKGCLHEYPLGSCSPGIAARRDSYSHHASAAKLYRRPLFDRHRTDWTLRGRQFSLLITKWDKVAANCDHLSRLKFASAVPYAFTEHGALMAASVPNTKPQPPERPLSPGLSFSAAAMRGLAQSGVFGRS